MIEFRVWRYDDGILVDIWEFDGIGDFVDS